ncbi:MAG: glutamyl-tRNA reductase [Chitinophagaceae bacterium]|nr:glutamyl-tRNA reductase [Chitinophagaceae bacterium]
MGNRNKEISNFYVVGINYKKTDASVRGLYAINNEQYESLLNEAALNGVQELFVLSTCNRTEIYAFAENEAVLMQLLCNASSGNLEAFQKMAYVKIGQEGIRHLFDVASGLDSQILGDYEIVGQLKLAVKFAKERECIGSHLERLTNAALQASKDVKANTALSGGTVSVAFAAVQYIKEKISAIEGKRILLMGTGKIGKNTCKNIIDYLGTTEITLMNRTEEKAQALAQELGIKMASNSYYNQEVNEADIVIVATGASSPVILKSDLRAEKPQLFIDLSIPYNIDPAVAEWPEVDLVNVDALSKIKDETLNMRLAEVPKAKAIINKHLVEFLDWHSKRQFVPVLKAIKSKLEELHAHPLYVSYVQSVTETQPVVCKEKIQRVVNGIAVKLMEENTKGCQYINAIHEYIATGTN